MANGQSLKIVGIGDFIAHHSIDGKVTEVKFVDILHIPDLHHNLLSVSQMRQHGFNMLFSKKIHVFDSTTKKTKLHVMPRGNLYQVKLTHLPSSAIVTEDAALTVQDAEPTINVYHHHYGHASEKCICLALKLQNIKLPADQHISQCKTCIQAKQT